MQILLAQKFASIISNKTDPTTCYFSYRFFQAGSSICIMLAILGL